MFVPGICFSLMTYVKPQPKPNVTSISHLEYGLRKIKYENDKIYVDHDSIIKEEKCYFSNSKYCMTCILIISSS